MTVKDILQSIALVVLLLVTIVYSVQAELELFRLFLN